MSIRTSLKTFASVTFLLLAATAILAACGSSGAAASSSATSGSTTTQSPARPRGGGFRPVSGTIDAYNASTQVLTVKQADGSTQTFSAASARILKSVKITQQQLSTLLGTSGTTVLVTGQQASDGTYTAQTLVVSDVTGGSLTGGGPRGGIAPNGTPGVPPNGTPGVRPNGTPGVRPNGTPGAGGAGGRVVLRSGKLQNNQLVGTDQAGKTITVNLSSATTLLQQSAATASDLKVGLTVTVTASPAQGSSAATARSIMIGDAQTGANQ